MCSRWKTSNTWSFLYWFSCCTCVTWQCFRVPVADTNTVRWGTKQKQQQKSHEDSADASACVQAQSCIASLPENPAEISTSIPLNLISTERIPFSFKENIRVKMDYVTLIWIINTIFLPNAVRICPKSSVGKNLVVFMLAFTCRSIILWAILVFIISISGFSQSFDVKLSSYIFMQVSESAAVQVLKVWKAQLAVNH